MRWLLILGFLATILVACGSSSDSNSSTNSDTEVNMAEETSTTASGLQIKTLVVSTGDFVVEFDNRQDGANHIHSVWRDVENDFAADVLRDHLILYHVL